MFQTHVGADAPVGAVVTKAVLRASRQLGLSERQLGRVIGLSEQCVSRMLNGDLILKPATKPFELSLLFIQFFKSLDNIASGDESVARAWLTTENMTLDARPIDLIQSIAGLMNVTADLNARCSFL